MKKTTKIGIIGAGHVGSHVASSLMTQGLCDEIVLLDTDEGKARRHADDIADSVAYMPLPAKIYAGGYEALADADIVVLSACSTIFEQDRLLELDATVKVIAEIAPQLTASGFSGIVVSISNPCDVIAQYFARITGLNVVGTGTALDSARLRRRLAAMLGVSPHSVCAYELGEHFVCVTAEGRRMKLGDAEKQPLYHLYQKEEEEKTKLKLIPYYMWNNRGEGEMQVWIRACE